MGFSQKLRFTLLLTLLTVFCANAHSKECVVLLHGYLRNAKCMKPIESYLLKAGYDIQNISYPSTDHSISKISSEYIAPQIDNSNCEKIHFIGHSMGGIIVRYYLSSNKPANLGKVVLITTPNSGSELVESIYNHPSVKWILIGPAVRELMPGSPLLKTLPMPDYEVGIITANKSINPITSILFNGPSDGTLSVDSMKLENMSDIIDINSTHTMVLIHPDTHKQISNFLKYGKFIK